MPLLEPLSPPWWVDRLWRRLGERRRHIDRMDAYYRGEPEGVPWLAEQAMDEFRRLLALTRSNYMGLVVDATAERLQVEGFRIGDNPDADRDTWRIWQANHLDDLADQAILEALITGCSYMLVAPSPGGALVTVEHPSQSIVEYAPGSSRREREAGLKAWEDDRTNTLMATLYLPDRVFKFQAPKPVAGVGAAPRWEPRRVPGETWPAANPLGVVPLVELENNPRLLSGGVSEIADVICVQDRINKTLADRMMTQDYGAFPQRWAIGYPDIDAEGQPTRIDIGRNRMVTSDAAETRFGQWDAAPLDPYSAAKREDVKDIASRTRTPAQYLLGELNNVNGQALALDTPIPTPNGLVAIGDLRDGDKVYDERGQVQTVEQAHAVLLDRPCYRITFDDGAGFVADGGHRWPVVSIPESKRKLPSNAQRTVRGVLTTADIAASLRCVNGQWAHAVELASPPDPAEVRFPIDPYVLGVFLGDGCKTNGTIACGDADLETMLGLLRDAGEDPIWERERTVNQIICGRPIRGACDKGHRDRFAPSGVCRECDVQRWRNKNHGTLIDPVSNVALRGRLAAVGLLRKDKHIPERYFAGSFKQRLSLLQGVMDTDGSAVKRQGGCVELGLQDERLARDVYRLVCSLGHKTSLRRLVKKAGFGGGVRVVWHMRWHPQDIVFRFPRKAEIQAVRPTNRPKVLRRTIVAVDRVPSVPVRCLTVSGESHLYLAGVQHVPTHNTLRAAESGLVSKVRQRMKPLGEGLEEVMTLARRAAGIPTPEETIETIWRNPEFRTEGELTDSLVKMASLGVPHEALWERWGASQVEISRWRDMADEQAARDPVAAFARQQAGNIPPPPADQPPPPGPDQAGGPAGG